MILIYFLDINEKARVRFNDIGDACIVPYDGTPFIILAIYERNCIYGKDKHKKKTIEEVVVKATRGLPIDSYGTWASTRETHKV